jgi:hypothetical protein
MPVKQHITRRIAGAVGVLVGVMSILAGSQVLLGFSVPGYTVWRLLVAYNVLAGVVSVVAGAGLWRGAHWSSRLATAIAAAHLTVLLILAGASARGALVASESFGAMTFRSVVWLAIAWIARRRSPSAYDGRHRQRA